MMLEMGLDFFSDHLLEDLLVEGEVGDQALQARILLAHLAQRTHLGHPRLPNFFFQRSNVASAIPVCRQTFATGVPDSARRRAYATCASLYRDFFIASPSRGAVEATLLYFSAFSAVVKNGENVTFTMAYSLRTFPEPVHR